MTREEALCYFKRRKKILGLSDEVQEAEDMAIKALEREPCEDCISRQDLLKKCVYVPIAPVIKGDSVHYEDVVFARDIINAEPIQKEPKTDGYYISGEDALLALTGIDLDKKSAEELIALFIHRIKDLPSVNQKEPKTGHWIYTGDYITDGMLKCSECGFEHDVSERFLYCPNCGAKKESEG